MAIRRFCDLCDEPLVPADDKPFVRIYVSNVRAVGHIMIMNAENHVLTDVCNGCKLKVVNEGIIMPDNEIVTLQPAPVAPKMLPLQPSIRPETTLPPPLPLQPSIRPQTTETPPPPPTP